MSSPLVAVEIHGFAQAVAPGGRVPTTGGIGGEVDVGRRAFAALSGELGPAGEDAFAAVRLGGGYRLTPDWALTLAAGPTLRYRANAASLLLGVTHEWDRGRALPLRVGVHAMLGGTAAAPQAGLHVTVGLTDHAQPRPPVAPPVVEATPWSFDPDETRIWVPHPVCDWLTPEEFAAAAPSLPPDVVARAYATGHLPTAVPRTSGAVVLLDAPAQGSVILAASPGDRVSVSGVALPADNDGVYVTNVPVGSYEVEVVGGGRRLVRTLEVTGGEASWLTVPPPSEQRVFFDVASAALRPTTLTALDAWVALAGDATLTVSGGASPEGKDDENRALAAARSLAVYDALIARGVPADHVRLGPVLPQDREADPQAQRVVILTPGADR